MNDSTSLGRAGSLVSSVQKSYLDCVNGKAAGHEVALFLEAPYGSLRVLSLFAYGPHLILANIQSAGEHPDILYHPVEMASFRISHFKPSNEKDRIVVGFSSS